MFNDNSPRFAFGRGLSYTTVSYREPVLDAHADWNCRRDGSLEPASAGPHPNAVVKSNWKAGRRRVYRPWVVEPGMWAQWDWGHGPKIAGRQTFLFCAWLAWSRFRVVLPVWDKTLPTVISCLDRSMGAFGGVPTYWLTDNERTVPTGPEVVKGFEAIC